MADIDHLARATVLLRLAEEDFANRDPGRSVSLSIASATVSIQAAAAHAAIEQAKWLREIADQLDTLPRRQQIEVDRPR